MKTIKERAKEALNKYDYNIYYHCSELTEDSFVDGYVEGATEQRMIDEGIIGNEKEIPSNINVLEETRKAFLAFCYNIINGMYISVEEAAKEQLVYLENNSCNSDKNLQDHFLDATKKVLTWQDIKRVLDAEADLYYDILTKRADPSGTKEYYEMVLERFNNNEN